GAEQIPPIVARGVLLDVARHRGVDVLAPGEQLGAGDLAAVARAQEVEVREGDVVALRTGRMLRWQQPSEYMLDTPGINVEGAGCARSRCRCGQGSACAARTRDDALRALPQVEATRPSAQEIRAPI